MYLKKVIDTFEYHIVGGSEYQWNCYGQNVRYLDFESEHAHASALFDTVTKEIYEVIVTSKNDSIKPYRYLNPQTKQAYFDESRKRKIDPFIAWDTVKFVDCETEEDFCEKANSIFNGLEFDDRVEVPLELTDDEIFQLMKMAHARDMTLNQLVESILTEVVHKEGVLI